MIVDGAFCANADAKGQRQATNEDREVRIAPVSEYTVRLSVVPVANGVAAAIHVNGSLTQETWGAPAATLRGEIQARMVKAGGLTISVSAEPLTFAIATAKDEALQKLSVDQKSGAVSFLTGDSPLLGLGEGGPQFDRRGSADKMISGQGGYHLATHGGRVPIPWIIGTGTAGGSAWAIYVR